MPDYDGTTTVSADEGALFAYLSDVENLPEYFARMTEAHATGAADEVHTEARMPDGQTVEGEVWFRVDEGAKHIAWGSESENSYNGYLDVTAIDGGTSSVKVFIHSPHTGEGHAQAQVQQGVDETLATIKEKVEARGVATG